MAGGPDAGVVGNVVKYSDCNVHGEWSTGIGIVRRRGLLSNWLVELPKGISTLHQGTQCGIESDVTLLVARLQLAFQVLITSSSASSASPICSLK